DKVLSRIGKAHGKTAAQVSLRFLVQQGIAVIPRTSRLERLAENLAIFDFELSPAEVAEIARLAHRDGRIVDSPSPGPRHWDCQATARAVWRAWRCLRCSRAARLSRIWR